MCFVRPDPIFFDPIFLLANSANDLRTVNSVSLSQA